VCLRITRDLALPLPGTRRSVGLAPAMRHAAHTHAPGWGSSGATPGTLASPSPTPSAKQHAATAAAASRPAQRRCAAGRLGSAVHSRHTALPFREPRPQPQQEPSSLQPSPLHLPLTPSAPFLIDHLPLIKL